MADRDTDTDADASADHDEAFVFGEDRSDASARTGDRERADASTTTAGGTLTTTTAVVGVVAALVLIVAGVQLFGPGVAAVLDGGGGDQAPTTPIDVATTETPDGETTDPARETDDALATPPSGGDATDDGGPADGDTQASGDGADDGDTQASGDGADDGDTTSGDADAPAGTSDGTDGDPGGTGGSDTTGSGATGDGEDGDGGGGFVQTDTGEGGPPVIESVSVIDDSQAGGSGGTLVYEVGWTVTDPDGNLDQLTVTVLEEPDGDTTTLSRRPLQIGGARNQSSTTFEAPIDSLGNSYEVRVVAEDQFGNSVNVTRREVANGESD